MKKKVALCLASGGARGFAHIGAIEELERRGYEISAISGTSMGAFVGGIYAAGGLEELKKWALSLDTKKVLRLTDFTFSTQGFMKGNKVLNDIKKLVPDVNIEDMKIPFTACATDIKNGVEVDFDKGSLYEAIRASISLPSVLKTYKKDDMILIDGGIVNPFPLNRVKRTDGDILVGVDVSVPSKKNSKIVKYNKSSVSRLREKLLKDSSILARMFEGLIKKVPEDKPEEVVSVNFISILSSCSSLMIERNSALTVQLTKPDVLAKIHHDAYGTMDFGKANEIIKLGVNAMKIALDEYEAKV